eukprot:scaffold368_cov258-Pinguiococcus_pyrenoidosus.AAC.32
MLGATLSCLLLAAAASAAISTDEEASVSAEDALSDRFAPPFRLRSELKPTSSPAGLGWEPMGSGASPSLLPKRTDPGTGALVRFPPRPDRRLKKLLIGSIWRVASQNGAEFKLLSPSGNVQDSLRCNVAG